MPVKVQCGECQKGLKVPDASRGKVLKCPGCGAKIKVPGAAETVKTKTKEPSSQDSGEILAHLDLNKVEDEEASICPQCGAEVYEDDEECGKCGFELAFGSVREAKKAALEGRKTDLGPFYAKMLSDAWAFTKAHMGFVVSTWGIFVFASTLVIICAHLAYWCATWPTKSFWSFFGIVCAVVPLGWIWLFHTHIIRLTARKKKNIDKFPFDFSYSSMAGLTAVVWFVIFSIPLLLTIGLIGAYFTFMGDIPWAFPAAVGVIALLVSPMLPITMSHQAMPITYRGWLFTEVLKTFGISFAPALYWWIFAGISYLMPTLVMAGILFFSWGSLEGYKKNFDDYTNLHGATVREALKEKKKDKNAPPEKEDPLEKSYLELRPEPFKWTALILPFTGVIICSFMVSMASVFNARTNGLYTYYLKNDLNLIQHVTERKYIKKEVQELEFNIKRSLPCPNGARFMATGIDHLIVILIGGLMGGLTYFLNETLQLTEPMHLYISYGVAGLLFVIVYIMFFISAYTGPTRTTPGKELFNTYVCLESGEVAGVGAILIRQLILLFSILLVLVPAIINGIIILSSESRRGFHDMAAGTVVRQRKKPKVKKKKDEEEEEKH